MTRNWNDFFRNPINWVVIVLVALALRNLNTYRLLAGLIVLCTAIPVHEYAHAWMANQMGDSSARRLKRLSLNPLDHIDPIGALMILFLGFGFARPVPINSMNFRDRKKGIILTSLAGPASNILMALVFMILHKLLVILFAFLRISAPVVLIQILWFVVRINISLAVFNLIPIPPLDGWHALSQTLPSDVYWKIAPYEQYLVYFVLFLAMMGVLTGPISALSNIVYSLLDGMTFFLDVLYRIVR